MSIAFKNWVMEEQEKDEERMIYELKQKEFLQSIKQTLRTVTNDEVVPPSVHRQISVVTGKINTEILRIEKMVQEHEQQENPPC